MDILRKLSVINRQLLRTEDMEAVFKSLMDAALEISGAKNGLLLLKAESEEGPLPGYRVVTAKNLSGADLGTDSFTVSLSAVREAAETGNAVVTDNALQDPRFQKSKSVALHGLKSILALPLKDASGVMGVFYLDNPLDAGVFSDEAVASLEAFGDTAALALQKSKMIAELKASNSELEVEVQEEMGRRQELEREMESNRLKLKHQYGDIVGKSPRMISVLQLVDKITDSKVPVWIFGESGTGKEAIARALHFNSARAKSAFVSENCSALPEALLESELFGHKKGAFTHADRDKKGRFEYANKGTVFLDEIADMSLNLQAKLLRFLQEGEVRPVGANDTVKVDVRVVSASNKDLHRLVEEGKFREDLFYRLNGITVTLPPLRERMEDLPLLIDHFLKEKGVKIHADALRFLMNYPWPGNIRELQNTIETAALFAEDGLILPKSFDFKPAVLSKRRAGAAAMKAHPKAPMEPELEKILIAVRDQGYHKGNAAKVLGISRRNLYTKLEKYGVPFELKDLKTFIDERFI